MNKTPVNIEAISIYLEFYGKIKFFEGLFLGVCIGTFFMMFIWFVIYGIPK